MARSPNDFGGGKRTARVLTAFYARVGMRRQNCAAGDLARVVRNARTHGEAELTRKADTCATLTRDLAVLVPLAGEQTNIPEERTTLARLLDGYRHHTVAASFMRAPA